MILVDTSVWIDFFNARDVIQVEILEKSLKDSRDICICGVILSEVLQGIKSENQFNQTRLYFENLIYLPMEYDTFVKSADIFRKLRMKGITIRKPIDCMIAAVCLEYNFSLLHNDRDFDFIENYLDLKILKK